MEVDSLVVSLGLDPKEFQAGLSQVATALQNIDQTLRDFAQGFVQGMQDALDEVENDADGANKKVKELSNSMQDLGRQWGSFLRGIVTRFAAPMAGALSVGAMVGSYLSGVSQVAQMYGRWTPQMEEWRKKQELLSRVNRDDIELYRKGRLALMDFQFAMAGLSTTIMRALSPAIRAGIELLHQVADWVRRNEPNIIRFVTVLAGTITAVLLPALVNMGLAMLANPLTWIIAGIIALAVAIDDLIVYIQGGESAFGDFWAIFGTGEEIAASLGAAWERLKEIGSQLWTSLKELVMDFFSYFEPAIAPIENLFLGLAGFVHSLLFGTWEDVGASLREVIGRAVEVVKQIFAGLGKFILDTVLGAVNKIPDAIAGIGGFFKGLFGIKEDENGKLTIPKPLETPATGTDDPLGLGPGAYSVPSSGELTATAVSSHATTNRSTQIESQTHIGTITVVTQATDAEGIARDMGTAVENNPMNQAVNAADGGMY
ncbi:MAG: hypothetical protein J1E80_08020 [Desulfovibrionaceae bacterium]|nr:hypothetical protein [Desulfovibrionaceae bacterium]